MATIGHSAHHPKGTVSSELATLLSLDGGIYMVESCSHSDDNLFNIIVEMSAFHHVQIR